MMVYRYFIRNYLLIICTTTRNSL